MNHPSEQILELYLLNDDSVIPHRLEIEEHLKMCSQCRDLYEEIRTYYQLLEEGPKQLSSAKESSFGIIVQTRQRQGILIHHSGKLPQRFWNYAKRRPFVTSAWTFVLGLFLYTGINSYNRISEENPANYRFNEANNMLEIFNANDEILWSTPIQSAESYNRIKSGKGIEHVDLRDLDGDRKNEIITSLDLTFDNNFRTLRVFRPNKQILFSIDTLAPSIMQFRNIPYVKQFYSTGFKTVIVNNEINIILLGNNGRSPQFVARIDKNGKILGRYWHFGQIGLIETMDVDNDGDEELVLFGMNDTPFPEITYSVMIVLDPEMITGDAESSASRGFGFPAASYERIYLKFPRSDLDIALQSQTITDNLQKTGNVISIYLKTQELRTDNYNFEYSFLNGVQLVSVKGSDPCARIYEQFKKEGLVHGTYGDSLFDQIKKSVLYFNGEGWQSNIYFMNRIDHSKQ